MSATTVPSSPFKGLAAYGDSDVDALLFFGRARETEIVTANLQASRLTVLYGPSGVGKSSLLRAGVAHRLRREPDAAVEIVDVWTGDAAARVREAVDRRPDAGDLYLLLDQFEEYFVYHRDEEALPRLLGNVLGDRGLRVNVLIGIREDALARLDGFRGAIPNLLGNRLRLDRLDRDAGRAAISGPIERYDELTGAHVAADGDLVEVVLDEVAAGQVALGRRGRGGVSDGSVAPRIEAPYLQLVLERLWETERAAGSDRLRLETLRALGGAAQIVHDHLERAMASLTEAEQETAAEMYHHLVTPSGTKISHRIGDLAGYAAVREGEAAAVLEKLTRERIVRASSQNGPASSRYEIYHDVLADAVLAWRARREEVRAVRRAEAQRRRAHVVAAAAIAGLLVVAGIAVLALLERGNARGEARHARAGELVAEARAALGGDPRASITLAVRAAGLQRSPQAEEALRDALIASQLRAVFLARSPAVAPAAAGFVVGDARGRIRSIANDGRIESRQDAGAPVTSLSVAPDGSYLAGTRDGRVIRGPSDGETVMRLPGAVTALAAARRRIAAGTAWGEVTLRQAGRPAKRLHVRGRVTSLAFGRGGRLLLVVSLDRRARLVDSATGRIAHVLGQRGYVNAAAFSPDGRLVVTASQDGTARVWDVQSGRSLRATAHAGGLTAVAFSPDGKLFAVASSDGVARVYGTATGAIRYYLSGDTGVVTDVAFHPRGVALVTASADRTARIWMSDVGRQLVVLRGHGDAIHRAFFTSDGARVVTAAGDGTVRLWSSGTEPELRVLVRGRRPFVRLERRADGTIAATDDGGLTRILDARARRVVAERPGPAEPGHAVSARRGDLSARALPKGVVAVARGGRVMHRLRADAASLAFSPDGRLLASGGLDTYLRVWDVESGRQLYAVVAHQGPVPAVVFSPDGRWIVTGGPISARVWSARAPKELLLLRGPAKTIRGALFTADGRTIVTAGADATIRTYDCVVCGAFDQLLAVARARLAQTRPR